MGIRKVRYKPNEFIAPCPKCGNNTEFTIRSEQVCEDGCEIWAECKCGYDPTSYDEAGSGYRIESVWGGTSDESCEVAIHHAWNEPIEYLANKPINSLKNG